MLNQVQCKRERDLQGHSKRNGSDCASYGDVDHNETHYLFRIQTIDFGVSSLDGYCKEVVAASAAQLQPCAIPTAKNRAMNLQATVEVQKMMMGCIP